MNVIPVKLKKFFLLIYLISGSLLTDTLRANAQSITENATANLIRETVQCAAVTRRQLDQEIKRRDGWLSSGRRNKNEFAEYNASQKDLIKLLLNRANALITLVNKIEIEELFADELNKLNDEGTLLKSTKLDFAFRRNQIRNKQDKRRSICGISIKQPSKRTDYWLGVAIKHKADSLISNNNIGEAARLYEQALMKFKTSLGIDHIDLANFYEDFAKLLIKKGLMAKAELLDNKALKIRLDYQEEIILKEERGRKAMQRRQERSAKRKNVRQCNTKKSQKE